MEAEYLFLGHSTELYQSYEERKKLPPGYKLLMLTECDIQTKRPDIEKAIDLASVKNLNVSKFRVFNEGDPYPSLRIRLLDDMVIKSMPGDIINYVAIGKSGVYSVPLNLEEDFTETEALIRRYWRFDDEKKVARYYFTGLRVNIGTNENIFEDLKKTFLVNADAFETDGIIEFQFQGAFFPNKSEIKEIMKTTKTLDELYTKLTFSIEDLFEKLGPGTYIIPTCRSVAINDDDDEQDLLNYISDEIDPELADKLTLRRSTNRLKYRKQKLNYLNTIKNHPKLQEDPWKEKVELVRRKLGRIIKTIQNTRSKSALKHRGARKTRRN
jgi:hypothetical protein